MTGWGVDGCKGGWFFVGLGGSAPEYGVVSRLEELLSHTEPGEPILVDIPIGLRESGELERTCDREAWRLLSPSRSSSVFPAPARPAVYASDYPTASDRNREAIGRGLSRQSWAIAPKIREVDELLERQPELIGRVREVHPEVCFWALAGQPMPDRKQSRAGYEARIEWLDRHAPNASSVVSQAYLEYGGFEAERDDIVDAFVAALTALHLDDCRTVPSDPEVDPRGIPMEMLYWQAGREAEEDGSSTGTGLSDE